MATWEQAWPCLAGCEVDIAADREARGYCRASSPATLSQVGVPLCPGHLVLFLCHAKLGFWSLPDVQMFPPLASSYPIAIYLAKCMQASL